MDQQLLISENLVLNEEAWQDWLQHRKEIRKTVKPGSMTEKNQQKLLCQYDHATQAQIIEHSITMGYMGLFPPKTPIHTTPPQNEPSFIEKHTDRSWRQGLS